MKIGETNIIPFQRQAKNNKSEPKEYRLVVKRKPKEDKQLDLFTMDAYESLEILLYPNPKNKLWASH